jgi:hypothetical protein
MTDVTPPQTCNSDTGLVFVTFVIQKLTDLQFINLMSVLYAMQRSVCAKCNPETFRCNPCHALHMEHPIIHQKLSFVRVYRLPLK